MGGSCGERGWWDGMVYDGGFIHLQRMKETFYSISFSGK